MVESAARAEAPALPEDCIAITSPVSGSVWQIKVAAGQAVEKGDTLVIMEAMKMEIAVLADSRRHGALDTRHRRVQPRTPATRCWSAKPVLS